MTTAPTGLGYADLSPQEVLDALDSVGLHGDGRVLQLNSYENRVFQVHLEDGSAVVPKFYRPGRWTDEQVLEEHRFALELAKEEVPVVAPMPLMARAATQAVRLLGEPVATLALWRTEHACHRFAVAPRQAGRSPELEQPGTLRRLGRFIGRLHAVGGRRRFAHRPTLSPAADAARARQILLEGEHVPPAQLAVWSEVSLRAVQAIDLAFAGWDPASALRLHGDCHPGNVLWRDQGPHVVDLDDACNGPAVQDLWMLISGDASTMQGQLRELLSGYEEFRDFDDRELALIEALRTLRMIRYSAWLAARWGDPAFPLAFPHFGSAAYWDQHAATLREQLELMSGGR